jgi:hypothetical protein
VTRLGLGVPLSIEIPQSLDRGKFFMKYLLSSMLLASGLAHGQTCPNPPVGAAALGYTTQLFYDQPQLSEVSTSDTDSTSTWYPGSDATLASRNLASLEFLSMQDSELVMGLGGGVSSETHDSKAGALPLLSGARGFYVEVAMHLSSNDNDHFIGLFLQTVEHDLAKDDHLSTDPAGFERWTEIDLSESGYGPSSLSSVMNWSGIWPDYGPKVINNYGKEDNNYGMEGALDWTKEHRFGVSYDPAANVLQYYIDDTPTFKTPPPPDSVIKLFHYYLVMEAGSHGSHVPYDMYVHYVTAYTK